MKTALRKLYGDIGAAPWRYIMMVVAIAVSSAAVVAMLLAYIVLTREVQLNYMATNPSSAQIMLGQLNTSHDIEKALSLIGKNPLIDDVEMGAQGYLRVEISPNELVTALIFILPDPKETRINKSILDSGEWPGVGEIMLERKALQVAQTSTGKEIKLIGKNGAVHPLRVRGTVHDPALAPADTENIIYGYMSTTSYLQIAGSISNNFIKFTVIPSKRNLPDIESITQDLIKDISPIINIHEIRVPPPNQHPHQTQMTSGLRMLLLFSVLAVVLGAVLIANTIWGLLAQQVQQIGIMKTIGATSTQIFLLYLILVVAIGLIAFLLGFPLGIWMGNSFIFMAADLLNLTIASSSLPISLWILNVIFCVGLPILMTIFPIRTAALKTVRAALDDAGISIPSTGVQQPVVHASFLPPIWMLMFRNMLRRRGRLVFIVSLLAIAGATFTSSLNLLASWNNLGQQAQDYRHYQIEGAFPDEISDETIESLLQTINGINAVEIFTKHSVAPATRDGVAFKRVYPDGGHGTLNLYAVPAHTDMFTVQLIDGSWLDDKKLDEIVINQSAHRYFFPEKKVGDHINLSIQKRNQQFRLSGVISEPLSGPNLYISPRLHFNHNVFRVRLNDTGASNINTLAIQIEKIFKDSNISLYSVSTEMHRQKSGKGHLMIMVLVLIMIAFSMIVVGFLSLTTVMSTNVSERLREFAVMRTLGAKQTTIFSLVTNESILIALLSCIAALPIMILLSFSMVQVLAGISMQPLMLAISGIGLVYWLLIVIFGALLAAFAPALNATRFSIREALTWS